MVVPSRPAPITVQMEIQTELKSARLLLEEKLPNSSNNKGILSPEANNCRDGQSTYPSKMRDNEIRKIQFPDLEISPPGDFKFEMDTFIFLKQAPGLRGPESA